MTISTAFALTQHPTTASVMPNVIVTADVIRGVNRFDITYRVSNAAGDLIVPLPRSGERRDGLWRHTCFELFLGSPENGEYVEFNASPSGDWAIYQFKSYRVPGPILTAESPLIRQEFVGPDLLLSAGVDSAAWGLPWLGGALLIGVSAVLQHRSSALAYHAMQHVRDVPDFHDTRAWHLMPAAHEKVT